MVMRHFLAKAGLATLLLTAGTATNAEYVLPPGMTGVADFGAIDCATFTHMYPAGPTGVGQAVLSWAQGYIYASSGNTLSEALDAAPGGSNWDFFSLREFIVDYCEQKPEAQLPEAVTKLWATINAGNATG